MRWSPSSREGRKEKSPSKRRRGKGVSARENVKKNVLRGGKKAFK